MRRVYTTSDFMFELDFRNILVLVSLAIHAQLLWILLRYGRKTPGGRAYSIAILAIAGWVFPMVLYRTNLFNQGLLWARLLYLMASFTSTSFLFFTFVFPDDKKISKFWQLFFLLENSAIVLLCLHPTLMIREVMYYPHREAQIFWGPLYGLYTLHISVPFLIGFGVLLLKLRKAKGVTHKQIISVLVGYFLASNLAMATNLILPWFGYFELNWIGQFFSTIVAIFTTYAILRHKLLNIRLIATEAFVLFLLFFLFIQLLFSNSEAGFFLNSFIFIAVFVISILLIRSVKEEVRRREEVTVLAESLERANIRLQELDKQKTEFLSIASHQLRTPLSILNGYIELIKDGAYGKVGKKQKQILQNMDDSNGRLIKLVDEFLNITRIEQGRAKFDLKEGDMRSVVDKAFNDLDNRARQKGLTLDWQRPKEMLKVYMDEEKVGHVIFNFIDNAIKYSEKGKVVITAHNVEGGVEVRVNDMGLGFDKSDEVNFFQKFYRGENVRGTNVTGTGLGLYVCRKFIEAHKGKVWAKSPGLGRGSEFGYWIPHTSDGLSDEQK